MKKNNQRPLIQKKKISFLGKHSYLERGALFGLLFYFFVLTAQQTEIAVDTQEVKSVITDQSQNTQPANDIDAQELKAAQIQQNSQAEKQHLVKIDQQPISKADRERPSDSSVIIRVLLEKHEQKSRHVWNLSSKDFLIIAVSGKSKNKIKDLNDKLTIKFVNGKFRINNDKDGYDSLFITSNKNNIAFNKHSYLGGVYFTYVNDCIYVVNYINLEDYICSVAMSESCPTWPMEVNKTFFIMFRSYALTKIFEARASKKKNSVPYDIENSTVHQVYKGKKPCEEFKKISEETKGLILIYNNKPLEAMFDVCCGGVIPSRKKGLNFYKAPYLARAYPCNYCKDYKFYRWQFHTTFNSLLKVLKNEFPTIKSIKEVRVACADEAGVVQKVKIRTNSGWVYINGNRFKSLLKLKSLCFNIKIRNSNVTIHGKGYGHLTGLCQHGAYKMVLEGWNYKNILKFYYPNCSFMKLQRIKRKAINNDVKL